MLTLICTFTFSSVQVHCLGLVISEAIWSLYTQKLSKYYGYDRNTSLEIVTRLTYIAAGHVSTWYSGTPPNGGCSSGSGYLKYLIADDDDGNLENGTPHMQAIFEAFNDLEIACSSPQVRDSGCERTPTEAPMVTAVAGSRKVSLSWNKVLDATVYEVFRTEGPKGCDMGKIKLMETTSTTYEDTGLQDGREYYYVVIPKGSSGSCFGPSSSCTVVAPMAEPEIVMTCPSEKVILNLYDTLPQARVECIFESVGGFEGTANLSCQSQSLYAKCNTDQNNLSFSKENTFGSVSLVVEAIRTESEGNGEVAVTLSYGAMKKTLNIPIWRVYYGEPQSAQFDSQYLVPTCSAPGRFCSSDSLLEGRGSLGPESNAPNTLQGSCRDGMLGSYKSDESIEKVLIRSGDVGGSAGNYMKEGSIATVEATVYAYGSGAWDTADFYYASDALNPSWVWITSIKPDQGGLVTLKASYTLPESTSSYQAVRVSYRYKGEKSPCSGGSYDEADDLGKLKSEHSSKLYEAVTHVCYLRILSGSFHCTSVVFAVLPRSSALGNPTGKPTRTTQLTPLPTQSPIQSPTVPPAAYLTSAPMAAPTKKTTAEPMSSPTQQPFEPSAKTVSPSHCL